MAASGIVRPRQASLPQRILAWLIYVFLTVLSGTLRWRLPTTLTSIPSTQPAIFCIWHNRLALCLIIHRHYARKKQRAHRMAALVSASRDGGMLARILEHFGVRPVRGSSSRRGAQALLELTSWGERGFDLAITPDGPRGPCYQVQKGIISLAQITAMPIVPACYHLSWKWRLHSWDRFQVPLPLSRCELKVGEPLIVPRDASDQDRERLRQELEQRLRRLTVD